MIATGGLLRINARRQDSLRSKNRKEEKRRKRKAKKKRKNEIVVVKGRLKLCSVSGLLAALGILVLLGGVFMASLGYWPREGLFFPAPPQGGATRHAALTSTPAAEGEKMQGGGREGGGGGGEEGGGGGGEGEEEEEEEEEEEGGGGGGEGGEGGGAGGRGGEGEGGGEGGEGEGGGEEGEEEEGGGGEGGGGGGGFNGTENFNRTDLQAPRDFLDDFLDRYLYSDRLKVFGPLIMGIGIFLFICANAVLHENRDKKTKVINLRDIYSTVIDLHSLRKSTADGCPSANPLNGLVNYVQSRGLEGKPSTAYAAALLAKRGGGGAEDGVGRGPLSRQPSLGSRGRGGERDGVFSIYQEQRDTPLLSPTSSPYSSYLTLHLPNPDPDLNHNPNPKPNTNTNPNPNPSQRHPLPAPSGLFSREAAFSWPRQQWAFCGSMRLGQALTLPPSHALTLPPSHALTLPLSRPRVTPRHPHTPTQYRRHSARAQAGRCWVGPGRGGERWREGGAPSEDELLDCREYGTREHRKARAEKEREEEAYAYPRSPRSFRQRVASPALSCSTSSLPREASVGSQALLLLSSSSSLSHLLSSSSSTPPVHPAVDRSGRLSTEGYTKLAHMEGESFESSEVMFAMASGHGTSEDGGQRAGRQEVTPQQRYSNKEKLMMISQTGGRREEVQEEEMEVEVSVQ